MPRHHTIWDSETQSQVDVAFTPEEETARDAEEVQAADDRIQAATNADNLIQGRARLIELLQTSRSNWTTAQLREMVELAAREMTR